MTLCGNGSLRLLLDRSRPSTRSATQVQELRRRHRTGHALLMSVWRILSFLSVRLDKIRRRWKKWLGYSRWKTKRLGIPATKIQAVVWMAGVKHTVLHYYKFRRGLIALQGVRPAVHRTRDLTLTLTFTPIVQVPLHEEIRIRHLLLQSRRAHSETHVSRALRVHVRVHVWPAVVIVV